MQPPVPFLLACAVLLGTSQAGAQAPNRSSKQTLYYIPHTHWEGAVFFTREEYLQMGLSNILSAIRLLEKYPDYKFALDQVAYFKPFLERYPELAGEFRKFVKEGRLEIVGGMDVMPDDVKPGGELFVRQIMYGKRTVKDLLGIDVPTAWLLDTFGHHPQMPQLLKLGGFDSFWFCRGQCGDTTPSEFNWKGIDGTTIPSFWLPGFYGLFYGPPKDQAGFDRFFVNRFNALNPHVHAPERVGLAGVDVSEPEDYVTPLLRQFNAKPDAPFNIRYSVPSEFAQLVSKRKDTPTLTGDFNPIFQGTYSSRIELKQTTRELEQMLVTAEKLGAISNWLGMPTDEKATWQAWEPVLFNQTHDLASGVMADHVYNDTVQSYAYSKRLAEQLIEDRWKNISSRIDTRGEGTPVIVFNPLATRRSDEVVDVDLGFGDISANSLTVRCPDGTTTPSQIVSSEKYGDGSFRRVKLAFKAMNVPELGYSVFHVEAKHSSEGITEVKPSENSVDAIESDWYKITLNTKTGEIMKIENKMFPLESLNGPLNVVARQDDKGDLWELYHTLDGASFIPATNKQPTPNSKNALMSNAFSAKAGTIIQGPLFSEFRVSHPFGTGKFSTRVRLNRGSRRIDFDTEIVNNEKYVRYQVLFPTPIKDGKNIQEIPFGAVERPVGVEYPAQNWVDYGNDQHGVSLLNAGLPGNTVSEDGTLMLSLLRSQTLGDYNEGHTSESGFELGIPRQFHYSLFTHNGDWRSASVFRDAQELNTPLMVFKAEPHSGSLPKAWSMVLFDQPGVALTTAKPGPDGTIVLRVYESFGRNNTRVQLQLPARVLDANESNLLEVTGKKLQVKGNALFINLHPFEIKTIKLKLASDRRH